MARTSVGPFWQSFPWTRVPSTQLSCNRASARPFRASGGRILLDLGKSLLGGPIGARDARPSQNPNGRRVFLLIQCRWFGKSGIVALIALDADAGRV